MFETPCKWYLNLYICIYFHNSRTPFKNAILEADFRYTRFFKSTFNTQFHFPQTLPPCGFMFVVSCWPLLAACHSMLALRRPHTVFMMTHDGTCWLHVGPMRAQFERGGAKRRAYATRTASIRQKSIARQKSIIRRITFIRQKCIIRNMNYLLFMYVMKIACMCFLVKRLLV